jgi:hypothetical protein
MSALHHPGISVDVQQLVIPSSTPQTTSGDDRQAAVEAGLYVAIGICAAFMIIILILMCFVVRLCRQWWWKRDKDANDSEDASKCD